MEATVAKVVSRTRLVIAVFNVVSIIVSSFFVLSRWLVKGRVQGVFICNFDEAI